MSGWESWVRLGSREMDSKVKIEKMGNRKREREMGMREDKWVFVGLLLFQ